MSHRTHRPRSELQRPCVSTIARACLLIGSPLLTLLLTSHAAAQAGRDEDELAASLGDRVVMQSPEVSIATGRSQPLRRAPAVASVVTAEDISRIGATDLDEVMETVPGTASAACSIECTKSCAPGRPCSRMLPPTRNMAAVPTTDRAFIMRGAVASRPLPKA